MKKIFALLLLFLLLLPLGAVADAAATITKNSGFEEDNHSGALRYWNIASGSVTVTEEEVHDGSRAIRMEHTANMFIWQAVRPVPGETYRISFFARKPEGEEGGAATAAVKLETYNNERKNSANISREFTVGTEWAEYSFDYTVSEDADYVSFMLRMFHGGVMYFDDVCMTGKVLTEVAADAPRIPAEGVRTPVPGTEQLFKNPGFTETENGYPKNWQVFGDTWVNNEFSTYETGAGRSDSTSVRISTDHGGYPWAFQLVPDMQEGARYQLTGWYNAWISGDLDAVTVKLEFYSENINHVDYSLPSSYAPSYGDTGGAWKQFCFEFTMPEDGKSTAFFFRFVKNVGTVYFDDVALHMVEAPPKAILSTDQVFYYPDMETGTATLTASAEEEQYVSFAISDEAGTLKKKEAVPLTAEKYAYYTFSTDFMEEKKEYRIKAVLYDAAGQALETVERPVYMYPRPKLLGSDGIYRYDGEPFVPKIVYHVSPADYGRMTEIGINVVQIQTFDTLADYREILDGLKTLGLKALVPLYHNMLPASHPDNETWSREIITTFKDHPAVFAWAVQDEPWAHSLDCEELLFDAYKLIRDIDDVHPVYICDCFPRYYPKTGLYVDSMAFDDYPTSAKNVGYKMMRGLQKANAAVGFKKPVSTLCSALDTGGFSPLAHEMRNQIYQVYFEGGTWGIYPYNNPAGAAKLHDSVYWDELKAFKQLEYDLMDEYFILHRYKNFNSGGTETWRYECFVKDGSVYAVVLNHVRSTQTVSIPLVSQNGRVRADGWTFSVVNGAEAEKARVEGDNLIIEMTGTQAAIYKLTPQYPMEEALLEETGFTDLDGETEVGKATGLLESIGAVPGGETFRPEEAVLRSEFAEMLIGAMGLASDTEIQFADVAAEATYAEATSAGKRYGIFTGTSFMSTESLTREDMYIYAERAIWLKMGENADVAVQNVKAMLSAEGFPAAGTATRGEAALVAARIYNFSGFTIRFENEEKVLQDKLHPGVLTAKVRVLGETEEREIRLFLALYETINNKRELINLKAACHTLQPGDCEELTVSYTVPQREGSFTAEAFLWDMKDLSGRKAYITE